MSTPLPVPPSTDPNYQFVIDYNKLLQTANDHAQAVQDHTDDYNYYHQVVLVKLDSLKTVDQIMAYLEAYVFQNSSTDPKTSNGTILGLFGDDVSTDGKSLSVNSVLTQVHNDIEKLTSNDSTDPVLGPQIVKDAALDLDSVLDSLKNNVNLQGSIDPTSLLNFQSTDTTLRDEFWIQGDDANQPAWNPTPVSGAYTYYFIEGTTPSPAPASGPWYNTSFGEMQNNMKAPGDLNDSTEAYKGLTDNFNADASMSQSINAAVNEQLNQVTNFIKTVLGFYDNGLLQPHAKLVGVAVQNEISK